jgi:hypothetical protein
VLLQSRASLLLRATGEGGVDLSEAVALHLRSRSDRAGRGSSGVDMGGVGVVVSRAKVSRIGLSSLHDIDDR